MSSEAVFFRYFHYFTFKNCSNNIKLYTPDQGKYEYVPTHAHANTDCYGFVCDDGYVRGMGNSGVYECIVQNSGWFWTTFGLVAMVMVCWKGLVFS